MFSNAQNYRPPYSQQASLGIEREITPGFTISVSGIYTHTQRLPVAIDTNLLKAPFVIVAARQRKERPPTAIGYTDIVHRSVQFDRQRGGGRTSPIALRGESIRLLRESADRPE